MRVPERIHFFSPVTGVSMELPAGFQARPAGPSGQSYLRWDDDDEVLLAAVDIRVLGPADDPDAAVTAAVDAMAAQGEELGRRWHAVDDERVLAVELHHPHGLPAPDDAPGGPEADLLSGDLSVLFAAVVVGGRLVALTFASPWPTPAGTFEQALASCRFPLAEGGAPRGTSYPRERSAGGTGVELSSVTSADLHLSLQVPVGWEIVADTALLRCYGPAADGQQPTFTIRQGMPEESGEDWFAQFREGAVARMPQVVPGFALLDRQDMVLSSWLDVTAVYYRRDDPRGASVSQLQAYLWADSYRMYVVDAATARSRESADLPLFGAILASIRLLPEQ